MRACGFPVSSDIGIVFDGSRSDAGGGGEEEEGDSCTEVGEAVCAVDRSLDTARGTVVYAREEGERAEEASRALIDSSVPASSRRRAASLDPLEGDVVDRAPPARRASSSTPSAALVAVLSGLVCRCCTLGLCEDGRSAFLSSPSLP